MSVYAIVGLVLVWHSFGLLRRRARQAPGFPGQTRKIVGIELVDVHALPIDKHTPEQVNAKVKYWRRYLLALLPMVTLLAIFVALHFVRKESSFTEAVYFGVVTATTVGFGDFGFLDEEPLNKCLAALGVMGVVVVFANAVDECLLIRKRQQLRHGKIALPSLEQLEALINGKRNAGEGDYISEADYVVEAALKGEIVDPQILLAIRRSFIGRRTRRRTASATR